MKLYRHIPNFLLLSILVLACEDRQPVWKLELEGTLDYSVTLPIGKQQSVTFTAGINTQLTEDIDFVWNAPGFSPSTFIGTTFVTSAPAEQGRYPVSVTARSAGYRDLTVSKDITVENCSIMPITVDYSMVPSQAVKGSNVTFTAGITSGTTPSEDDVEYIWHAPDFTPSTGTGKAFTTACPSSDGTYTVTVTAKSESYCDLNATKEISVQSCIFMTGDLKIAPPPQIAINQDVTFTAGGIDVPTEENITYTWSASGFTPSTGTGKAFAATCPPTKSDYPITVIAKATGYCDKKLEDYYVHVADCIPMTTEDLGIDIPSSMIVGQEVVFTAKGVLQPSNITYTWDAPNFTPTSAPNQTLRATCPNMEGTYTINFQATAPSYCPVTISRNDIIVNKCKEMTGTLGLSVSPTSISKNETITFTATGIQEPQTGVTYTWNAPGLTPNSGSGFTFQSIFPDSDNEFTVNVTANATSFCPSSSSVTISASCTAMMGVLNINGPESVLTGKSVTFTAGGMSAGSESVTYYWSAPGFTPSTGTGVSFTTTAPANAGDDHKISVTAQAFNYCNISADKSIRVINCSPMSGNLSFTVPAQKIKGQPVSFIAQGVSAGTNTITYTWEAQDFTPPSGSGTTFSTTCPPSAGNSYSVKVTATAIDYCETSFSATTPVTDNLQMPDNLIIHINTGTPLYTSSLVEFTPRGLENIPGVRYTWTGTDCSPAIGSGATYSTHLPGEPGSYTIVVEASAAGYETTTASHTYDVGCKAMNTTGPFHFTVTPSPQAVKKQKLIFTATPPGAPSIVDYYWNIPQSFTAQSGMLTNTVTALAPDHAISATTVSVVVKSAGYCDLEASQSITVIDKNCVQMLDKPVITLQNSSIMPNSGATFTVNDVGVTVANAVYTWSVTQPTGYEFNPSTATGRVFQTTAPGYNTNDYIVKVTVTADGYCTEDATMGVAVSDYTTNLKGTIVLNEAHPDTTYLENNQLSVFLAKDRQTTLSADYKKGTGDPDDIEANISFSWFEKESNGQLTPISGTLANNGRQITFTPNVLLAKKLVLRVTTQNNTGIRPLEQDFLYYITECDPPSPSSIMKINGFYIDVNHRCMAGQPHNSVNTISAYIKDSDGNIYRIVKMNGKTSGGTDYSRWWFAENLRKEVGTHNSQHKDVYGIFYDYHTDMADPLKGTYCPSGWRVPTSTEWGELVNGNNGVPSFLYGKSSLTGEGKPGWQNPGTDDYGFTLISTGEYIPSTATFWDYGQSTTLWLNERYKVKITSSSQSTSTYESNRYYVVRCILVTNP